MGSNWHWEELRQEVGERVFDFKPKRIPNYPEDSCVPMTLRWIKVKLCVAAGRRGSDDNPFRSAPEDVAAEAQIDMDVASSIGIDDFDPANLFAAESLAALWGGRPRRFPVLSGVFEQNLFNCLDQIQSGTAILIAFDEGPDERGHTVAAYRSNASRELLFFEPMSGEYRVMQPRDFARTYKDCYGRATAKRDLRMICEMTYDASSHMD